MKAITACFPTPQGSTHLWGQQKKNQQNLTPCDGVVFACVENIRNNVETHNSSQSHVNVERICKHRERQNIYIIFFFFFK